MGVAHDVAGNSDSALIYYEKCPKICAKGTFRCYRFKPSIEIRLYRICQELVNNILKHSEAKQAEIQLLKTKTHLVLYLEDDGKGFDPDKASEGIGLNNIFSRASSVNDKVNYEKGKLGTIANIRVPLS